MAANLLSSPSAVKADACCAPSALRADLWSSDLPSGGAQVACSQGFDGAPLRLSCSSKFSASLGVAVRRRAQQVRAAQAPGSTLPEKSVESESDSSDSEKVDQMNVADVMTRNLIKVTADTSVDRALEILVENKITGMPVVDNEGTLIGVVSDYDVLALDTISGKREAETALFPQAGSTWKAFKEIQKLLHKTQGRNVGEVMTPSPLVVRPSTNLESAARLLLESKYRRLPVVDENGKLVGLLTRGNVVRAALSMKKAMEARGA